MGARDERSQLVELHTKPDLGVDLIMSDHSGSEVTYVISLGGILVCKILDS